MKLTSIQISGYKSINSTPHNPIKINDVSIFLGANGVGKSNLVSFFSMLNYMMTGSLQNYIAEHGYADSFLHYGAKITREIEASIDFADGMDRYKYLFRLSHAAGDILIFKEETLVWQNIIIENVADIQLNTGGRESELLQFGANVNVNLLDLQTASNILNLLRNCKVFHFHDTSATARIRLQGYIEDNKYLKSDAGNLAAFLFRLKDNPDTFPYYTKIVRYIQKVMPQFGDFELSANERNKNYITLNWHEKTNREYLFGAHQISDGSLRFMCLATLLLQPKHLMPNVIVLDEPELGLHPSAIAYLAGMIKAASKHVQVLIATQSQRLVDEFDLENIVIVERDNVSNSTTFQYKNPESLSSWLEDYSLSELWEKNVIGGQP